MICLLGVGGAFTTSNYWHTNYLLLSDSGKFMLIDCGTDVRHSLYEFKNNNLDYKIDDTIDAVYISHDHADHAGGLEWVGFTHYTKTKPKLFLPGEYYDKIVGSELKRMSCNFPGVDITPDSFFYLYKLGLEGFVWEEYEFKLISNLHIKNIKKGLDNYYYYSYGLVVKKNNKSIYISTDTVEIKKDIIKDVDLVFHDCQTKNQDYGTHTMFDSLYQLPYKNKIVPVHYDPNPPQSAVGFYEDRFPKKGDFYDIFKF